ncbi:MAG: STAS domain-containing protein [Vulcanimicrobiaceae bacterium]
MLADAGKATSLNDATLTVGLDDLGTLDATAMGSLVVALRRMREAGGSVMLHVTRPELLSELAVSGLDRVFKIVAQTEPPVAKKTERKQSGGARKIAGGLA